MLATRIARFIADPAAGDFNRLAIEVFRFQYDRILPFRQLCEARQCRPEAVTDWRSIPAVPTLAFKTLALSTDDPQETFRSSGTRGARSVHRNPYPQLYRDAVDASFPTACLRGLPSRPAVLGLVPDREQAPDSSLAFMIDHVITRWGGDESLVGFGPRGVDVPAARSWIATRQRQGTGCLIAGTSFALASLLEALERRHLRFRLPAGSVVFDTGGFKGHTDALTADDLTDRIESSLGLPPERVVREYGMTELSSQAYTGALTGSRSDAFQVPHWMRVQALAPETLEELPPGGEGLLTFVDLANLGSAVRVLTEDVGRVVDAGFQLVGRAPDSELRGCSLTVEELAAGSGRR